MNSLLGEIKLLPYDFAPQGFAQCNGQILSIGEYPALFSLLGNKYGGDGRTTFMLPKLNKNDNKDTNTHNYNICMDGIYPTRY